MRVSASQLKTYALCPKKWYLEKVEKVPPGPPGYGATFGTVLHACLERLQTGEEIYPEGWEAPLRFGDAELVQDLISMYQPLGEEVEVEKRFEIEVIEDITMVGYIDLLLSSHVIDHKSTSSFKWALSAEDLARDLQMMIYGYYALQQAKDKKGLIKLQHNVFLRRRPAKRRTTVAYVSGQAILEKWEEIKSTALEMKQIASGERPDTPMGNQCHKYGGCPFAGFCAGTLTRGQLEKKMGALDDKLARLAAAKKNGNKPPPAVSVAVAERKAKVVITERIAPLTEPTPAQVEDLMARSAAALEKAAVRELRDKPPVVEEPGVVKKKRGRPRKKSKNVTPSGKDAGFLEEAYKDMRPPHLKIALTVFIGSGPVDRRGAFLSMEQAFRQVVGDLDAYHRAEAFKRRDNLVAAVGEWVLGLKLSTSVLVTAHPLTWGPDTKAFVWALRLRATQIVDSAL